MKTPHQYFQSMFANVDALRQKNKRLGKSKRNSATAKYRECRAIRNRLAKISRRKNRG